MCVPGRQEAEQLEERWRMRWRMKEESVWGRSPRALWPREAFGFCLESTNSHQGFQNREGDLVCILERPVGCCGAGELSEGRGRCQETRRKLSQRQWPPHPWLFLPSSPSRGTMEPTFTNLIQSLPVTTLSTAWGLCSKNSRIIFIFSLPKEQRPREGLWCCQSGVICFYFYF